MKYDMILIDTMSLLYKLREKSEKASILSSKYVFKNLAKKYIEKITELHDQYLVEGGSIALLFDNPTSR